MPLPLQSVGTLDWPNSRVHGAYVVVVGLIHHSSASYSYIVFIPMDRSTIRVASERVIPLDETKSAGIFDPRRNRNETVSWRAMWQSINWWPVYTNLPNGFVQ